MSVCDHARAVHFQHRVAEHAASGALRDLLEHRRLSFAPEPLSEGAVFGFSGALDLRVRITRAGVPAIDLDGRAMSLEIDLCRHLGLAAEWICGEDPGAAWELLHDELTARRPTLVRADIGELDHRDGPRHDARHAIVVTSYDEAAGVVWIADQSFPEPQRCTLQELAAARRSRGWPEPVRHALLRLDGTDRLAHPRACTAAALTRVVCTMRHPPAPGHPHVHAGLAAADALADAWPRLAQMAGSRLAPTLAGLHFRIRGGGTGGALYRSLQARFLHDVAALLGSAQLSRAALICDDLADAWRALAAVLAGEDADAAHRAAGPWIARVRMLEHCHVEALEDYLALRRAT